MGVNLCGASPLYETGNLVWRQYTQCNQSIEVRGDRVPHAAGLGESVNILAETHCEELNRPVLTRTPGGVGGASE
jgi:hypothetical protein